MSSGYSAIPDDVLSEAIGMVDCPTYGCFSSFCIKNEGYSELLEE
jgi:hypothetical protein